MSRVVVRPSTTLLYIVKLNIWNQAEKIEEWPNAKHDIAKAKSEVVD